MAKASHAGKIAILLLIVIVGGGTGLGYFNLASKLDEGEKDKPAAEAHQHDASAEQKPEVTIDAELLKAKPTDIILGDANALVTVVEYASLTCPHCAHFVQDILPELEKRYITTGKVKFVYRHFPLNEPAIKGAELVECAQTNNLPRENFVKVLFSMQQQWAFSEKFLEDLKKIALVGGIDSAAFDSCMADKELETRVLSSRQEAETKLGVTSTPTLFVNGAKYEGEMTADAIGKAIEAGL